MDRPTEPSHFDPDRHDRFRDRVDDFADRIEDAAIRAEYETGERESSDEEARSHVLVRVARMTVGFIVVIIGIAALPLPGPGWLIIAGGLAILARDVAWADRLLRYIRRRVPGIPEDGKIPRSSMVTMAVVTLAAVSASLWWSLGRGSDEIQPGRYDVVSITDDAGLEGTAAPDLTIELTTDGPVTLEANCATVTFDVVERDKSRFRLTGPTSGDDDLGGCPSTVDRLVAVMAADELQLGYETDGIVAWFLADDQLATVTAGSGDQARIDLVVEPAG